MTILPNLLAAFRFMRDVFRDALEARRRSLKQYPNLHNGE
jgi:hypothetical protein